MDADLQPQRRPQGGRGPAEAPIPERRFVGKNVCHTLLYDRAFHATMPAADPGNPATVLFMAGMEAYLRDARGEEVARPGGGGLHLHPEIGTWVRGRVAKIEGGWGTVRTKVAT